jgi:hypothetical protein
VENADAAEKILRGCLEARCDALKLAVIAVKLAGMSPRCLL